MIGHRIVCFRLENQRGSAGAVPPAAAKGKGRQPRETRRRDSAALSITGGRNSYDSTRPTACTGYECRAPVVEGRGGGV